MNRTYSLLILIYLGLNSNCQDISIFTEDNLTIESIEYHATEIKELDLPDARKIDAAFTRDVIEYFQLDDLYDSELKRKVFKESNEYADKLEELEQIKTEIENSVYYIHINPLFKENLSYKGEYNIEDRGFYVKTCWSSYYDFPRKIDENYIHFRSLPSELKTRTIYGQTSEWEEFFIPVDESIALEIENNPTDYSYYVVFKITGLATVKWTNVFSDGTLTIPEASQLRLLVVGNISRQVIFDRVY